MADLRAAVAAARRRGLRVGLVPTMGALHEAHLSLVRAGRKQSGFLVVSIFVNPLQFGPGEDYAAYPRDLAGDEAKLATQTLDPGTGDPGEPAGAPRPAKAGIEPARHGPGTADTGRGRRARGAAGGRPPEPASRDSGGPGTPGPAAPDVVFAPPVEEVYPRPAATTVSVPTLTEGLCGASRPGHFDGVATVVAKLFNLVRPDVAFFGRKDFQQLQVIRRMVEDLNFPVEVVGCPTVRDADGVAVSSRNDYLSAEEHRAARVLSRGLRAAVEAARKARRAGRRAAPDVLREAVAASLHAEPLVRTDYVEVVDPETLTPPDAAGRGEAGTDGPGPDRVLVACAAHVGAARLIDNVVVGEEEDEQRLLAATGRPGGDA